MHIAVTRDGDIISVCSNSNDKTTRGRDLLEIAVQNGGKKLDAYSGLFGFYRKCGFEPVSYCEFDERFAPPDWTKGVDKPEPIIFWKYTGNKSTASRDELADECDNFLKTSKCYSGDNGYSDAQSARDNLM